MLLEGREIQKFLKLLAVMPTESTEKSVLDQATTSMLTKMHLSGCEIAQTLMRAPEVIEIKIIGQM